MRGVFIFFVFCSVVGAVVIKDRDAVVHIDHQHAKVNFLSGKPWTIHHNIFGETFETTGKFIQCSYHIPLEIDDVNQLVNTANAINAIRMGRAADPRAAQTAMCKLPTCINDVNDLHVCGGFGMPYYRWKWVTGVREVYWDSEMRGAACDGGPMYTWKDEENRFVPATDGFSSDMEALVNLVKFAHSPILCSQLPQYKFENMCSQ